MNETTVGTAAIRPATEADLWAIRDLLTLRDGHAWDDDSTRWFVRALDPERCRAWLAFEGAKPVGFTNMFLRELSTPWGAWRAGYWANLFIDPDHRGQLLYPRLPLALFAAARAMGLDVVYTTVRLRDVSLANTRLGFAKVGDWPVLMKLLRPARLLGKHRGWAPLTTMSAPLDALYGGAGHLLRRRAPSGIIVEEIDVTEDAVDPLVEMLMSGAVGRVVDSWTPERFRYRYRQTREGGRYHVLAVRRAGRVIAGLAYRVAERGRGIRAGVIMDAVAAPGDEPALALALEHAESRVRGDSGELMLFLNGLGPDIERVLVRHGYHPGPERYDLLVWPKEKLARVSGLGSLSSWRFGFADHDAF